MRIHYSSYYHALAEAGDIAQRAERLGYDVVQHPERQHNPFLPCVLAADRTTRIGIATNIAVAFARSPMDTAYLAWDLQQLSGGRFSLGLGTQVKGHITRRYSQPWGPPAPRIKEYVAAIRAIWDSWQNGAKLDYRGEHFTVNLMTPYFNPGPIEHPQIPIFVAAVGAIMAKSVGQVCDGLAWHQFHTARYLQEVVVASARAGAQAAGRDPNALQFHGAAFIATGATQSDLERGREAVKKEIAFYASTPAYHPVLALHGWQDVGEKLHQMSRENKWDAMSAEITDEIVDAFAVTADYDHIADKLKERYGAFASGVTFSFPTKTPADEERLAAIVQQIKA